MHNIKNILPKLVARDPGIQLFKNIYLCMLPETLMHNF
jgi:hypothetical protein